MCVSVCEQKHAYIFGYVLPCAPLCRYMATYGSDYIKVRTAYVRHLNNMMQPAEYDTMSVALTSPYSF